MIGFIRGYALELALAAIVGLALLAGVQSIRLAEAHADLADERRERADDASRAALAVQTQVELARKEDQRRYAAQQEALDATNQRLREALAARAASDDSAVRMRATIAALNAARRAAAAGDPAAAPGGSPAAAADLVPAELYEWADGRARELAAALDAGHDRGQLCAADYDTLTR